MSCKDGIKRDLNNSPVTPSIADATTDLACTSSPTLVRSVNTGASHNCWIGRAGQPYSVTHHHLCVGPRPPPPQMPCAVPPYRLAGDPHQRDLVTADVEGEVRRAVEPVAA